jgi:hypothetical protein
MPFKKRKEAKALRAEVDTFGHLQEEKQFAEAIEKAVDIKDPAKLILELRKINQAIAAQIQRESNVISNKAAKKEKPIRIGGVGAGLAAGSALLIFAGPVGWVGLPVMFGISAGSAAIAFKRERAFTKKQQEASGSHTQRLEDQMFITSALIDKVVETNVDAIAKSPLCGSILALPGIADKFSIAAAKHVAAKSSAKNPSIDDVVEAFRNPPKPPRDFGPVGK